MTRRRKLRSLFRRTLTLTYVGYIVYNWFMRANPGGQLDLSLVFGRDEIIARLWKTLEMQSCLLVSDRRTGKTTIVRKMHAEPPNGVVVPNWRDVEALASPAKFAESVYNDSTSLLSKKLRLATRTKRLLHQMGGGEVSGVLKLPTGSPVDWRQLLLDIFADLAENHAPDRIVFFWDELPLMLQKISKAMGADQAMALLNVLRTARQMHETRMVITGSIGLHHVIRELRDGNERDPVINDLRVEELLPFPPHDGRELARRLLEGEGVESEDSNAVAQVITEEVCGVPYYIHHIVKTLTEQPGPVDTDTVRAVVRRALVHELDPWNLRHYEDRLEHYYGEQRAQAVVVILDEIAVTDEAVSARAVLAALKANQDLGESALAHRIRGGDLKEIRELLRLLSADHYLAVNENGFYQFRLNLIQRWWKLNRGL